MLEKVLPAVVSVRVEERPVRDRKSRKNSKSFLVMITGSTCTTLRRFRLRCHHQRHKGYVLTNNHVINQAQKISIRSMMGASLMQN